MNRISIALCTYNGARFLSDQLKSIVSQHRQPDEVIVCDDSSSDGTGKILHGFAKNAPFPVKLFFNEQKLGPTNNFDKAIRLCEGNLIALCDQDDVWYPQKLKQCERFFDEKPDTGGVFCNAEVTDQNLHSLGYDIWQKSAFTVKEQQKVVIGNALSVLIKHYIVTGATLIFKADLKPIVLPIPSYWFHDAWIALLIASVSSLSFIHEPMMKYRQHSDNQLGGKRKGLIRDVLDAFEINRTDYFSLELEKYRSACDRLKMFSNANIPLSLFLIDNKINHLETRLSMNRHRTLRIPSFIKELASGRYAQYARNWGSVAMDLLFR
ncbi:MAG: glycosyltransferase family 2 protein [Deltaproteobacteria bacterium]|nr:glycosyltransferase family 2 protein [Deltaproteobacteria bacterium]